MCWEKPINKGRHGKPIARFRALGENRLKPCRWTPCQKKVKANGCLPVTPERSRLDFALPFFDRLRFKSPEALGGSLRALKV